MLQLVRLAVRMRHCWGCWVLFDGLVVYCLGFVEWLVFGFLQPVQLVSLVSKWLMTF